MKKYFNAVLAFLACLVFTYLSISFVSFDMNPANWDSLTRFLLVLLTVGFSLIAFAISYFCCSFLEATFDITKWIPHIRFLNIAMCCFLTFIIFDLINKEHKDR